MRIKSKFELNFVHIAVLAICPLIVTTVNFYNAFTVLILSLISLVLSSLVCLIIAKNSSKTLRVFIAALVSALVVTGYELLVMNKIFEGSGNVSSFAILSSIVLCVDLFYIDTKVSKNYLIKIFRLIAVYSFILMLYASLKELFVTGTIGGLKIINNYVAVDFFKMVTFDFLVLGLLCALVDRVVSLLVNLFNDYAMVYNKYKQKIRGEKAFIYEYYRRKKLLTSEVEINEVGKKEDSEDENDENDELEQEDKVPNKEEKQKISEIKHKPKGKSRLRVSKEARLEKMFDRKGEIKEDKE